MNKFLAELKHLRQSLLSLPKTEKVMQENQSTLKEIEWGLIFNNAIADSPWFIKKSLNPGRWAAGYPMLNIVYRIYNDVKPTKILEFGLGETSKLSYQFTKWQQQANLTIIEQDREWLEIYSTSVFDVSQLTNVLEIEMVNFQGNEVYAYKNLINTLAGKKFDFIMIDGPWGSPSFSRYQIIDIVENDMLEDDFIILLDDHNRVGEQQTADHLKALLNKKGKSFIEGQYSGVKQTLLICSPKYRFLVSL